MNEIRQVPFYDEIPGKRVRVFKCPECGREERIDDSDLKNLKGVFCGDFSCKNDYCVSDRIEIVDADGNVTAVIV
jgi:hypothetical protein